MPAEYTQEKLVLPESLAFTASSPQERLAGMSIHFEIKRRREAMGLSHAKLADKVSKLEGLAKPLSWQTVQQWEREDGTAPKRKRLEFVAKALDTTVTELVSGTGSAGVMQVQEPFPEYRVVAQELDPQVVSQVLRDLADLQPSKRSAMVDHIHQAAEEARDAARHLSNRNRTPVAAAKVARGARTEVAVRYGDGNPNQGALPLTTVDDPWRAAPDGRELALYKRIESASKK